MCGYWPRPTSRWSGRCEEGLFREDLFYRLNVITIHIPPLRERREEIPVFLEYFLRKYSEFYGKQPAPFGDYAVGRMMEYTWPGNIRELENLVKRYVIVGNESQIIRELSTHKPISSSTERRKSDLGIKDPKTAAGRIAQQARQRFRSTPQGNCSRNG